LNELDGVAISADRIDRYPSIPINTLIEESATNTFLSAFDWVVEEIRNG